MNASSLGLPSSWRKELQVLGAMAGVFLVAYYLPLSNAAVQGAIQEAFKLLQWYVRNHTLACVVPAMFIAGAVTTFLSKESVMNYLGPRSNRTLPELERAVQRLDDGDVGLRGAGDTWRGMVYVLSTVEGYT